MSSFIVIIYQLSGERIVFPLSGIQVTVLQR